MHRTHVLWYPSRVRAWLVLLLMAFAAAACGREGGSFAADSSPTPVPSASVEALPTVEPSPTASASASPSASETPSASPTASPKPTPTPIPKCVDTTDASCGSFYFYPGVDKDEPVTVDVTYEPKNPVVGQKVTFTLHATDPDSRLLKLGSYRFTGRGPGAEADRFPGFCPIAYGKWDPPKAEDGEVTQKISYTYENHGDYKATFEFLSRSYTNDDHPWPHDPPGNHDGVCIDPLSSAGRTTVDITISDPTTPSPTP